MEDRNRELVFVDLKDNQAVPSMTMSSPIMNSPISEDTSLINEKISKARPRKAPDGLDPKERKQWDDKDV